MLTQNELKQLLDYNPNTGIFTWKIKNARCINIGDVAGAINNKDGYIQIQINKKLYLAHRLAWLYIYGEFPSEQIDHINHNRGDNRIDNLRCVSRLENQRNQSKSVANTSGHVGVSWNKQLSKWHAQIVVNYKRIHLGYFADINQAIEARKNANVKYLFHENHGVAA